MGIIIFGILVLGTSEIIIRWNKNKKKNYPTSDERYADYYKQPWIEDDGRG